MTSYKAPADFSAVKDITSSKDAAKLLQQMERDRTLSIEDRYRLKKQLMRRVFSAKQEEINRHLDSYEIYLLASRDMESRGMIMEARRAVIILEKEQIRLMESFGLARKDEISATFVREGEMLTSKLSALSSSVIADEIKKEICNTIRGVWDRTNTRILEHADSYLDSLLEKERGVEH